VTRGTLNITLGMRPLIIIAVEWCCNRLRRLAQCLRRRLPIELTVATRALLNDVALPVLCQPRQSFFERRLAGSTSSFDALLKRPQMRYGGSFGALRADDPDGAVRIIDCLNPIDPMSRDNPIPVHPAM
jgi:hypothetical protein